MEPSFGFQDNALQEKNSAIFKADQRMENFDSLHINIHLLLCICINYHKIFQILVPAI